MNKIRLFSAVLAGFLLFGCGQEESKKGSEAKKEAESQAEFPRSETFYIGGWDWAPPSTFNPLAGDPNFPIDGNLNVMYEALFGYDQMTGKMDPILAKSYEVQEKSISVTLDERAKWNDGTPVTVEDVLYTFQLDKEFPTPRHSNWNYISSVTAGDSNSVVFTLNEKNYNPLLILDMISEVNILPKAVFSALKEKTKGEFAEMLKFKNDSLPVVSGPYTLHKYYTDKIILVRNENYWGNVKFDGKKPGPKYIIHSLYNGNNHFSSAMTKGHLDMSSTFMPRLWKKKSDKIRAWSLKEPYHVPGSIPTVFMPVTSAPFDDVAFRRALAHAVNYSQIKTLAVSKYTPEVKPGFILPFGPEKAYYSQEDADKYGYSYDLEKARAILKEAGYSWNDKGALLDKTGKVMRSINLECPQGWTDWENTLKILRDDFRKLGIDAKERFVDYGIWDKDAKQGTFDLIMRTQTADLWPSTPWKRFEQVMGAKDWKPVNETMHSNFGRYKDDATTALLDKLPTLTDEAEKTAAYRELNKIFMQQVPVLTLMYRPTQFYQFSEKHWTNFPTEENPYASPQCLMIGAGIKGMWGIRPAAEAK
jgi:peptide/nickel transport system substrate-binding protein